MHLIWLLLSGFVAAVPAYIVGARCGPMFLEVAIRYDGEVFEIPRRQEIAPALTTIALLLGYGIFVTQQGLRSFAIRWWCERKGRIYPHYWGAKDLGTFDAALCLMTGFTASSFVCGFFSPFFGDTYTLSMCAIAALPSVFQLMEFWRKRQAEERN